MSHAKRSRADAKATALVSEAGQPHQVIHHSEDGEGSHRDQETAPAAGFSSGPLYPYVFGRSATPGKMKPGHRI